MPSPRFFVLMICCLTLYASMVAQSLAAEPQTGIAKSTASATIAWLDSLDNDQREIVKFPFDSDQRVDWHFIPKSSRKGLTLREMNPEQQEKAYAILQACLSKTGYEKTRKIMNLEQVLYDNEPEGKRERRDAQKFYFTVFGDPQQNSRWGLSVEGHHVSFNFVFEGDRVVSSTPQFLAANPAIIKNENNHGYKMGSQVLQHEQELAFALVNSLSEEQKKQAIIAKECPSELRHPGVPQPPQEEAIGLSADQMTAEQKKLLRQLISEYANTLPAELATERLNQIEADGFDQIHFAWAGATELGIGHYYRVQGSKFLIEFVNYQADAYNNPANHIHSVWRNLEGDFGIPLK